MTLKDFCSNSNIDSKLIKSVVRQIGGWEYFKQTAEDVYNCGAAGGFCGFTYYSDTCQFYAKNQDEIANLVKDFALELGEHSISFVRGFRCLNGDADDIEIGETLYGTKRKHDTYVANALAWFALEEVCRSYVDAKEAE